MINLADIRDSKEKFDNRYSLIDKIGGGGFSEVWLAHDNNAGIDVALKIYTPNGELDEEGKDNDGIRGQDRGKYCRRLYSI